jgi:hypothetical protein
MFIERILEEETLNMNERPDNASGRMVGALRHTRASGNLSKGNIVQV